MGKLQNGQTGFSVVEGVLILAIVGLLGFTGWYVYHARSNANVTLNAANKVTSSAATSSIPTVYKRTTTVPSDWKTYNNSSYKFSAAYPADWNVNFSVMDKSAGQSEQNDFSLHATKIGVLCYLGKGITQTCSAEMNIVNQTLQDTVSQAKKNFYGTSAVKLLSEKHLTIDAHQAVAFRYQQKDSPVEVDYFVYANGYTYALPTVYETDNATNPLSAKDSLTLFEAVKIQ